MKIEDIEAYKLYRDYTKEELEVLPEVPYLENFLDEDIIPIMWDGEVWGLVELD